MIYREGNKAFQQFVHKFGGAPDFDSGDGFVSIWDGADDSSTDEMQYTYSTTADIDTVSSSNAGDDQVISLQGLDANYNLIVQNATLDGQNKVTLSTSLIRIFRIKNEGTTDFAGDVYAYVDGTISAGVPSDTSTIRAKVQVGNNQTLMAIYTIPAGKTGYLRSWYISGAKGSASLNLEGRLFVKPFGKVFQLKNANIINTEGTSYINHIYNEPEVIAEKSDIEVRALASTTVVTAFSGFDIVLINN